MEIKKSGVKISLDEKDMEILQGAIDWLGELYNTIQDNGSPGNAEFQIYDFMQNEDDVGTYDLGDLDAIVEVLELIVNSDFIEIL